MTGHQVIEAARRLYRAQPDRVLAVEAQIIGYSQTLAVLDAMAPGDPASLEILRRALVSLDAIQHDLGLVHGFHLRERHRLHRLACSLLGQKQQHINAPGWSEDV